MNRIVPVLVLMTCLGLPLSLPAQAWFGDGERKEIRQGNRVYEENDYETAVQRYEKAIAINPENATAHFNLGDALYHQQQYGDAANAFIKATEKSADSLAQAQAYHNLGNSLLAEAERQSQAAVDPQKQKTARDLFKGSIDAYKHALRRNPQDVDTKYNLAYALKKLQQMQQQQQQQNQQQDKEDQDKSDQQQKQEQKQQQEQQKQEKQQQQQKAPQEPRSLSKEEAEQLLEMLKNLEEKIQEKVQKKKVPARKIPVEKDW